ncbi:nicotinate-nucleotide adenylyltransferase [Sphingobium subterraneum]|uniref:Probable nicotinate-nucleotide adenylyltransferase n=1 Tax=Sphingobium subterraneum TaxID=627688 RepID=A0A841J278_9SPHN|nr:nicotinate-nucleotide adenylyltransferase [Sphingobium subterraneum]MBB6124770.1 nicotinate-nucleotide adenylyltransferase [Sphingobium subterraneum]
MSSARRIGLLGGSFNPAHGAHRAISLFALQALALDEVWWLVSPGNPLKPGKDMAPLPARLARARAVARRAPIRATAIEAQLGTRYTVDTLRALQRRYPRKRFIWLMGGDNEQQFGQWKDWRGIARTMPIAVIARPGYDGRVQGSSAMNWLRRFVRPARHCRNWTDWRPPALVHLRFRPDPRSATLLRQADPLWHREYDGVWVRDPLTHALVTPVSGTMSGNAPANHRSDID